MLWKQNLLVSRKNVEKKYALYFPNTDTTSKAKTGESDEIAQSVFK